MKYRAFFIPILLITLFFGCKDEKNKPIEDNKQISLKTTTDEIITLTKTDSGFKDESNKVLFLNFFTTSCAPCNAQFPHLNNLQEKYKNELKIISVLLEEKRPEEIQNFIKDKKIGFDITADKNNFRLSITLGNITNVPYMLIYDKNGQYVTHYTTATPEEMIEADLKRIF
ncbi:MAG: TlpA family protein disulfide reductase [Campylobacteraceae bacterium]|jgi:thiol-disulfide isomerase/thioredoxin|nr:TlpA family protein disulfide reductase [Campylobacteraceae bacterium]